MLVFFIRNNEERQCLSSSVELFFVASDRLLVDGHLIGGQSGLVSHCRHLEWLPRTLKKKENSLSLIKKADHDNTNPLSLAVQFLFVCLVGDESATDFTNRDDCDSEKVRV